VFDVGGGEVDAVHFRLVASFGYRESEAARAATNIENAFVWLSDGEKWPDQAPAQRPICSS
jgi:hypothetical protein